MNPPPTPSTFLSRWLAPLYMRVLLGVILGALVGWAFGRRPIPGLLGMTTLHLGELALLIIRFLTALATPLIFFAILDAFTKTQISGRQGIKMLVICAFNVVIAFAIGLTILNVFRPAQRWREAYAPLMGDDGSGAEAKITGSLSPLENLKGYIPESFAAPFVQNNVMGAVLLAVLAGIAFRIARSAAEEDEAAAMASLERLITAAFVLLMRMLELVVQIVPFAVFGALAQVVGKAVDPEEGQSTHGVESLLTLLAVYLAVILCGLAFHALVYYPLVNWVVGGKSPWRFFREGADAILTGLSLNSSLATVPVTLQSLQRLGVSQSSSRLSACVGTNFNNDGISLYEAMTALFIAQAAGYDLSLTQQIVVMLASLMASLGIAGIPNSGLVVLPLVLQAAGLPTAIIAQALPLAQSVDWIAARCRSGVNVMGDMTVAILLDAGERPIEKEEG